MGVGEEDSRDAREAKGHAYAADQQQGLSPKLIDERHTQLT